MIVSCTTNFSLHSHWTPYTYLSDELWTPYTNLGDTLWTSYTNLSDNFWTPYTDLGDNRHENFEAIVEIEDENKNFQHFNAVHCDPEIALHHICRHKFSLNSAFNINNHPQNIH